ncbi:MULTISPECIES: class I SAM-dependent methyltransferase [unclassified Flavobacterium]|uniref:class I SAM-dependent methyltransferase n=1 Tax=unclassified Flavobacterium TaxID=196869 RepID=UPI001ACCCBC6|nr:MULTISPECIES: class I SAM-dependent methyltransferase [unclassified Flavobacterium]MBN9285827.1 class I SAM-dependent methyltransferase [Flavobacterium sp.]
MKKKWSGERLETFIYGRDAVDHLHRYGIALSFIKDKTVLDIACGEGYGTNLMGNSASFVYGVDIDPDTIEAAKRKYTKGNIQYKTGNTSAIPLEDNSVDVVISFETIEHHDQHDEMLKEIKRVLKPGGIVMISTPDKLYYTDERNFKNEFHIKELYKKEFKDLLSKYFTNQQLLTQRYINGNSLIVDEECDENVFIRGDFSSVKQIAVFPLYLVAIVSDSSFQKQGFSIFDGTDIIKKELENRDQKIYQSNTYKLGHTLLLPAKMLKKIYKKCLR